MRRDGFEHMTAMIPFVDPLLEYYSKPQSKLEAFLKILRTQCKAVLIPE